MFDHNKRKRVVSRSFIWLRKTWTSASTRIVLVSGLVVGTVTFVGAILNGKGYLTSLGVIDSKPLRVVSARVTDNSEGAKILELMLRNIGKEPIIMTDLVLRPKRIVDLKPCAVSLVSALQISSKYDVNISTAKEDVAISTELHQQIKGEDTDRFQIILESNKLNRFYELESYIISNENRNILPLARIAIAYTDVAAEYLPDEQQLERLNGQFSQLGCYYYNFEQVVTENERLEDAAISGLVGRARKFQSWLTNTLAATEIQKLKVAANGIGEALKSSQLATKRTGIDCRAVSELLQNPVSKSALRIVRRGAEPVAQRHICNGFLMNSQGKTVITTAAHCFFNRRTGARMDPQELAVSLIDDSEFPIREARINNYDIKTGGIDVAFVEPFEEVSFKNFNDQCVKKN